MYSSLHCTISCRCLALRMYYKSSATGCALQGGPKSKPLPNYRKIVSY